MKRLGAEGVGKRDHPSSTRIGSQSKHVIPASRKTRRTLGVTTIHGRDNRLSRSSGFRMAYPTFSQLKLTSSASRRSEARYTILVGSSSISKYPFLQHTSQARSRVSPVVRG